MDCCNNKGLEVAFRHGPSAQSQSSEYFPVPQGFRSTGKFGSASWWRRPVSHGRLSKSSAKPLSSSTIASARWRASGQRLSSLLVCRRPARATSLRHDAEDRGGRELLAAGDDRRPGGSGRNRWGFGNSRLRRAITGSGFQRLGFLAAKHCILRRPFRARAIEHLL